MVEHVYKHQINAQASELFFYDRQMCVTQILNVVQL